MKSEEDVLDIAYKAISAGAKGVDMGRNIWQSNWPVPMISAIRSIVHNNASSKKAFDLFNSLKAKKVK